MRAISIALLMLSATTAAAQSVPYQPTPIKVDKNILRQPATATPTPPSDGITSAKATWRRPPGDSPEPAGISGELRMIDPTTRVSHITTSFLVDGGIPTWTDAQIILVFKHKRTNRYVLHTCTSHTCKITTAGVNNIGILAPTARPTHLVYDFQFQHDTAFQQDPTSSSNRAYAVRYNPNEWRFDAIHLMNLSNSGQCNDAVPATRCVYKTFSSTPWTATQR